MQIVTLQSIGSTSSCDEKPWQHWKQALRKKNKTIPCNKLKTIFNTITAELTLSSIQKQETQPHNLMYFQLQNDDYVEWTETQSSIRANCKIVVLH